MTRTVSVRLDRGVTVAALVALNVMLSLVSPAKSDARGDRSLLDDVGAWKLVASEGVNIDVTHEAGRFGQSALRIDFDFTAGAGYGGVMLDLPMELPENYAFTLRVRGEGPANNLELKLVDPEGLNVWWVNRRAFEWPAEPTRLVNRRRHFQFAWGPSHGAPLKRIGRVELIIAANEGGRGTIWIDEFRFTPLPPEKPYTGTSTISATSGDKAKLADLLRGEGKWVAARTDPEPKLTIDFGQQREIGGLAISRPSADPRWSFDIEVSDDGTVWNAVREVRNAGGTISEILLPDLQTRYLRLSFDRTKNAALPAVTSIKFIEPDDASSPNAFWKMRAARAARGLYPRNLLNEQSYWTVIGQSGDDREALINEEGMIEVDRRGFSIEPFIDYRGKLLTWADGKHEQSLRDGWIPIPRVVRTHDGIELSVTALAAGEAGASALHAAYTLRNTSAEPSRVRLILALRALQVLPPWQDLNITGGWTSLRSIRRDGGSLIVNENKDAKRIIAPDHLTALALPFLGGDFVDTLAYGETLEGDTIVECPQQSAAACLVWEIDLDPGASVTRVISIPFHGIEPAVEVPRTSREFTALADKVAANWVKHTNSITFHLPPAAKQFHDTIRATQAYILINHDGQGFQPGSRTYERSWMRDGSMTSAAMLEFGHDDLVRRFIDWYAPFQFPSGKIPCVVDRRGADPVPEHDSHGQFLWLVANAHRYTLDDELVRRHFPRVKLAVQYIESLRSERLTDEFGLGAAPRQEPGKPPVPALAFRGLVPESISHEGYSAKPMHSFWDQLFVLRGLKDAVYLAEVAGEPQLAQRWNKLAEDFRNSIIESIRVAQQAHGIDYLPGCVELGDFDSTSSTILLWPVEEGARFPRDWIDATFERYWQEFTRRRDQSPATWEAYTPYELRHVGTYVRLGQKDRAWAVLNWLLDHQRPPGWRHWAEVVHRERSTPRMIGDMPHTWCGSDFLNAARAMFVYEDEQRLVLFAGVPDEWFADPQGVSFENLRSEFGAVSASATADGADQILVRIEGTARPPGGFELRSPLSRRIRAARVDGETISVTDGNRVRISTIPATIELKY